MSDRFEDAIREAVRLELANIAEEEIEAAKKGVEVRIRNMLANIVMATMRHFEVSKFQDRIVIEVRNKLEQST